MADNPDSPRVVCIIPARGGSKGLSKKNIRLLRGHPLVAWPVRAAQLSGVVDDVLVSTDDEDIAAEARDAGAEVPFLRPADLAQDLTTTEASLQQALSAFEVIAPAIVQIDFSVVNVVVGEFLKSRFGTVWFPVLLKLQGI